MTTARERAKHRRWADVVLIVASLYSLLSAGWAPLELLTGGEGSEVAESQGLWWTYALGGVLGLAALAASRRWPGVAKGLAAAAGVAVLAGFFTLERLTTFAILSLAGTGLAMIAAAPFVGPMPSPEEEGRPRAGREPMI